MSMLELPERRATRTFVVVSYDIVDDRRRAKVLKTMKDFGTRVQYSVFECELNAVELARLKAQLAPIIQAGEDSVRFYALCRSCMQRIHVMGKGQVTRQQGPLFVR